MTREERRSVHGDDPMKRRAAAFGLTVVSLAVLLAGCSGGTQMSGAPTELATRAGSTGTLPVTATPAAPAHAEPDPEAASVALDLANFVQAPGEQTFTITNSSSFEVDLDDWSVVTNASTSERVAFAQGLVLAPGESLTVHTKMGTNSPTDVYLSLPPGVAPRVYTRGDPATGFIDIVANDGPEYFRYLLPAAPSGR